MKKLIALIVMHSFLFLSAGCSFYSCRTGILPSSKAQVIDLHIPSLEKTAFP